MSKTVFVSGHFNVLHPGHLRLLRFARECGERLVVAVESDRMAGDTAYVPEQMRLEGVQSNSWVNEAFIMDRPITDTIMQHKPDIVVKGKEHEDKLNPELFAVEQYGGRLLFSSGETVFSSIDLLRREFFSAEKQTIKLPRDYLKRHDIECLRIADLLKKITRLKVCVIGDLIIDEYITCQPLGMSQEDTTIVVMPIDTTRFMGGAGIVAAHAAGLGGEVRFISIVGRDSIREFAVENLKVAGVDSRLIIDESRPTTLKQRYRSKGKSLLRVSCLHQSSISTALQKIILTEIEQVLSHIDLLVFSDFNYGCLPQQLVEQIIFIAKKQNVMLAADSQSSSQVGDISRFRDMDLITPTEREARISTRSHEEGLVILADKLRAQANAKNILLKLGEEGLLIHAGNHQTKDWLTDKIEALNFAPKDVAGAGDSLLIASAMALACDGNIWEAAFLGSLAAAVQVGRVGNTPIRTQELLQELV